MTAALATAGALMVASPAAAAPASLGGLLKSTTSRLTSALLPPQDPACAQAESTKPFATWGDPMRYVPVPNGGFEDGLTGWKSQGRVTLVQDNEPWKVGGADHGQALALDHGASVTSESFCGGLEYPTVRFFARSTAAGRGTVLLTIRYTGRDKLLHSLPLGILQVTDTWAPTGITLTGSGIPLFTGNKLGVTVTALTGNVAVDDLYVDPFRRS